MEVDPRLLNSFAVLAEELHFGRAAARLHITQPALSVQVRRLEEQIGYRLFARSSRNVVLTPAGQALLLRAPAVNDAFEAAIAGARTAGRMASNELVVSLGFVGGTDLAARVLEVFRARHPEVNVRVIAPPNLADLQSAVADGRADVGFVWWPQLEHELAMTPLFEDPLWVALPASHSSASLPRVAPDDVGDLDNCGPWSALPRALVDDWTGEFAEGRGDPPWGPDLADTEGALYEIASGRSFMFVVGSIVSSMDRRGLAFRQIASGRAVRFGVARREGDDRAAVLAFVDCASSIARREGAAAEVVS